LRRRVQTDWLLLQLMGKRIAVLLMWLV
jgi:hypothetical protein